MDPGEQERAAKERFSEVFSHLGMIATYARSRGAIDPEEIAAEVMTIAWRRLPDVPRDDPRPWLIGTARNLLLADRRRRAGAAHPAAAGRQPSSGELPVRVELDPELERALRALPARDREALLLVAWEDLTPAQAAASLGISATAFRVRLHRARRRLLRILSERGQPSGLEEPRPRWEQS